MANIKIRKIDNRKDYEKSGFKSMMDEVGLRRNEALKSLPGSERDIKLKGLFISKKMNDYHFLIIISTKDNFSTKL
ncbi:MAG: hypothetical protein WBW34_10295 [Nitrososphaeraceae archaeon]